MLVSDTEAPATAKITRTQAVAARNLPAAATIRDPFWDDRGLGRL
jgi:hypothetical protein